MGVPGLWTILKPSATGASLLNLAVQQGSFETHNGHIFTLGVDISIWFYNALATHSSENHELQMIFFRMARLLRYPCRVVFVFDGPGRPHLKRGTPSQGVPHRLEEGTKRFAKAFGYACIQAPGEAEAELAYLNRVGVIDAVLSEDVDTLIFGACVVLRSISVSENSRKQAHLERVAIYTSKSITTHPDVRLSRAGLILMALLMGGDYDQVGLKNCGRKLAKSLAHCGFGEDLLEAATSPVEARQQKLDSWRDTLRTELKMNTRGLLNRSYHNLANTLPDTFPDLAILQLYLNPVTTERQTPMPPAISWIGPPDFAEIATRCEQYFHWGSRALSMKRFEDILWSGASVSLLLASRHNVPLPIPITDLVTRLHGLRQLERHDNLLEYRAEIASTALASLVRAGVQGQMGTPLEWDDILTSKARITTRVWLPGQLVRLDLPTLVQDFASKGAQKARNTASCRTRQVAKPYSIASPSRRPEFNRIGKDLASAEKYTQGIIEISSDEEACTPTRSKINKLNKYRHAEVIDLTQESS